MIGVGIGLPFFKSFGGVTIDAQAQAHYNRVIADGGVVPSGLSGVNAFFSAVKTIYATADITTAISAAYDPHYLGYKLGAGSGTTLGQAAQKLYSCSGASGDVVQTTAASQPLLLAHGGASTDNYWFGSGLIGNVINTSTTLIATTQLDVSAYVIASAGHTVAATIISNDGTARNFVFNCLDVSNGILQLRAGTPFNNYNSTVGVGSFDNYTGWIRATYTQNGSNGDVRFYTSSDSKNTPYLSLNWIQLGSVVTIASTSLQNGTNSIQIGANQGSNSFTGKIGRATIATTIGGAPVVDFNPASYNPANSQTQWTSTTGEVWTINTGTATTGYKGVLVDRSLIQGDGIDDVMQTTNSIWGSTTTIYSSIKFYNLNSKLGATLDSDTGNSTVQKFEGIDIINNYFVYQDGLSISINVSTSNNLLRLYNSVRNGASSALNVNNGIDTTGTLNSVATTGIRILNSRNSAATYYTNGNLTSIIISSNANNSTQRTAMYNAIKSYNNGAF